VLIEVSLRSSNVNSADRELATEIRWEREGVEERRFWMNKGEAVGSPIVQVDPRCFRPTEVETLLGDASKAREILGWTPGTTFRELVAEMIREALKAAERDDLVRNSGYTVMNCHE